MNRLLVVLVAGIAAMALAAVDGGAPRAPSADAGVTSADAGEVKKAPMSPEVKALVDRMQAFYEKTQDFTADFSQEYYFKTFKRKQLASGQLTYLKPAMMRWEYLKPSPRTAVLAGDKVYAFDPEAKLLTRAAMSSDKLSASVTFLWGQGKLADEFSIAVKPCPTCKGTLLELTPLKADPRFQRVQLEVDVKTAQVLRSVVVDPDGSTNTIVFGTLTTNTGVDAGVFKLSPPPGTQVQDFLQGGAAVPKLVGADGGERVLDAGRASRDGGQ